MPCPSEARLWAHVSRSVIPLGSPVPGERPLRPRRPLSHDIDLHGDTVHAAHARVAGAVGRARAEGRREIVVVTGRSGRIRVEFPTWAALDPRVRSVRPIRGDGAFLVRVRPGA
jgi:DNA-nicking Smr family endonuclease